MLINPYVFGYTPTDSNAAAYIAAVEAADGAALESAVRQAIDQFVIGCKADGIWNAIKASCILAGARTLAGALVPLAGTAPINNNFVSGDYNRKNGLTGNASNKNLNSNISVNAMPNNSRHMALWVATKPTAGTILMGAESETLRHSIYTELGAIAGFGLLESDSSVNAATGGTSQNFIGASRATNNVVSWIYNAASGTYTKSPGAAYNRNIRIFCRDDSVTLSGFNNATISFYSIGDNLSISALSSRVSTLMSAFASAIP